VSTESSGGRGADRIREVFTRVRQKRPDIADLFCDDAVIVYGKDSWVEGREAIRAFYRRAIDDLSPQPTVQVILEAPPLYVAIIEVHTGSESYRALDLFELADDKIRRLEIYSRSS